MNDKLLELKKMRQKGSNSGQKYQEPDIEDNDNELMPQYQQKVQKAKTILEQIKVNNEAIKELKEKYSHATTTQQEKQISDELDILINKNQKNNENLKAIMNDISLDVTEAKQNDPENQNPETQMKVNMQQALAYRMNDIIQEQQTVQIFFKQGLKQKISRQTKYLDSKLSDEQIDEICNNPQKANELLQQKLYGDASQQLQNAVSDIQDKFRDIQKLEQSVYQVYQLFSDMAMLVHQQGEMLDDIEININDAKRNVNNAEKNLKKAKEEHMSAKKKTCLLIVGGLVVIAVILGPVLASK